MARNTPQKRPTRGHAAVGYARRSTDRQEHSIPDQKRAIEQYAQEQDLGLLRFYVDDSISGTRTNNRPAFLEMIDDAQKSACDFGAVIVYDVKRFGRIDNDEAGFYRHTLRSHGVEVLYVSEGFNGSETDDLLRPVKQWQARQESKDLSKVTIRGLLSKVETGAWMGGVPPHGYDLRYENDQGRFLFLLRHMPDGAKKQLDEGGRLVRRLARGESVTVSKRDRAFLSAGDPARITTVQRIFALYTEDRKGPEAVSASLLSYGTKQFRDLVFGT